MKKSPAEIQKRPGEKTLDLVVDGEVIAKLGATFLHELVGILTTARPSELSSYRDFEYLRRLLDQCQNQLIAASRVPTPAESETLRKRSEQHGRGYWSTWMVHEPDPFAPDSIEQEAGGS